MRILRRKSHPSDRPVQEQLGCQSAAEGRSDERRRAGDGPLHMGALCPHLRGTGEIVSPVPGTGQGVVATSEKQGGVGTS